MVDVFQLDCLNHEHIQRILKVLKTFRPDFDIPLRASNVNNKLLNDIYQQKPAVDENPTVDRWWEKVDFPGKLNRQIDMENEHKVKVKSINFPETIDQKLVRSKRVREENKF